MKTLLTILVFAFTLNGQMLLPIVGGSSAVSHTPISQINKATAIGASTATTTGFDSSGGNFCVVMVAGGFTYMGGAADVAVGDSFMNSYTALTPQDSANPTVPAVRSGIWYSANCTVGMGHTATFTAGGAIFGAMVFAVYSNVKTSSPLDQQNGHAELASATIQAGSITPTENNELVLITLSELDEANNPTINGGFGYVGRVPSASGSNYGGSLAELIQTTAGAANPTWTTGGNAYSAVIASFKNQ